LSYLCLVLSLFPLDSSSCATLYRVWSYVSANAW